LEDNLKDGEEISKYTKELNQKIKHLESLLEIAREGLNNIAVPLVPSSQFNQIAKNTLKAITPVEITGADEHPYD